MRVSRVVGAMALVAGLLVGLVPRSGVAQGPERVGLAAFSSPQPAQARDAQQAPVEEGWTFLGTAKWAGLAIAGGTAVYGFSLNSQADELYDRLDATCVEEPDRCDARNPDGSFRDEELEALYQDTLAKDRQARTVLIISQVAVASAVVFFIMDLSNRPPENIPYDPPVTLGLGAMEGGGLALAARVRLPTLARGTR